jgi:hypothetical protein
MSSVPTWFGVVMIVAAAVLLGALAALLEAFLRPRRNRGLLGNPHHWNGSDADDRARRDQDVNTVWDDGG